MYLLRAAGVILSTIFYGTISLLASFFDPNGEVQNKIAQRWARSLLWVGGVRVEVQNGDRIPLTGSYVIASNHLSFMDTPVVLGNIAAQFRFMAKEGLFRIPLLGTHLARAGHIPVPLEDPRGALKSMAHAADVIKTRGVSVLIFPEGGRSADGNLQDFKDGASYIAIKAGVPIVPVALIGTYEVLPLGGNKIRPGRVLLRVGEPIETAALLLRDRRQVTEQIRRQIEAMLR